MMNRLRKIFTLIVFFACFFSSCKSYGLVLALFPEKGINTFQVKLSDLGVITPQRADIGQGVNGDLVLFNLPPKTILITGQQINSILQKKYNMHITIKGKSIKIIPLYTKILLEEITEKIKTNVKQIYSHIKDRNLEIIYLETPKIPKMPAGILKISVIVPRGHVDMVKYVRLNIENEGTLIYTSSFKIRLAFHHLIVAAKKNLKAGHRLKESDLYYREKDSFKNSYSSSSCDDIDAIIGKKLKRNVSENNTILKNNVK